LSSKKKSGRVKCPECGFENLVNASFCSGCGCSLKPTVKGQFEALYILLLVGSIYLFISLVFNELMQVPLFAGPSFVSVVLGIYASYRLSKGGIGRGVVAASAIAIGVGFVTTFFVFLLGLDIKGVFGPAWVIFLAAAYRLLKDRRMTTRTPAD
jgi:uncharacterized protein (DUF983 family)